MKFENYLIDQMNKHTSIQPQDVVKLCFQAAYGAEHLLSDVKAAKDYFDNEYAATESKEEALYEQISEDVCRVNLAAWKAKGLPSEWLFKMFANSSSISSNGNEVFLKYIEKAEKVLLQKTTLFQFSDWCNYIMEYKKIGMPAIHHSTQYREDEKPAYRVINSKYIRLFPILEKVSQCNHKDKVCVIAIDGRAASGKSTMAEQLQNILCADIIHMDDFFLPAELRTKERFATPGGNIHHERFMKEVLPYVSAPQSFSYRIFDCGREAYNGRREINNIQFRIVEGSYSCHPLFGDYANITVFSDVESDEQIKRIRIRNGEKMAEMYHNKWIPLEEKYFEAYKISDNVSITM